MRDISERIQRYRLSRYAPARRFSLPPWVWVVLGLWILRIAFVSDHSLYQLWRIDRTNARERVAVRNAETELRGYERLATDPRALEREAETHLREDQGWSRPNEIVFRIGERPAPAPAPAPASPAK